MNSFEILTGQGLGLEAVRGEVFRLIASELPPLTKSLGDHERELEILQSAVAEVAIELRHGSEGISTKQILQALEQMLLDPELLAEATKQIEAGWDAASAMQLSARSFADLFAGDDFLAERGQDLIGLSEKVARRILNLAPMPDYPADTNIVLVCRDLTPDQIAGLPKNIVAAILAAGSNTSHSAIMLRALGLPTVIRCAEAELLRDGELVLVDPVGNRVVRGGDQDMATRALSFVTMNPEPLIPVRANIGSVQEAFVAGASAADGVGLVRTEFLYLGQRVSPGTQQQADVYEQLLRAAPEGPVLIRTIDVAGDKELPFLALPAQSLAEAAASGYRVFSLYPEFVSDQLKAIEIARRRVGREVSVMAPMISNPEQAREFVNLARGLGDFQVGIMLETPQIAKCIPELKGLLDFVSVGTNDLSQFFFNLDRYSPESAEQINYWHPSFVLLLEEIAKAAKEAGISAGVCGESAADPEFGIVLAGLGFESLSVSVSSLSSVRSALTSASLKQAQSLARLAVSVKSAAAAQAIVRSELSRLGLES